MVSDTADGGSILCYESPFHKDNYTGSKQVEQISHVVFVAEKPKDSLENTNQSAMVLAS